MRKILSFILCAAVLFLMATTQARGATEGGNMGRDLTKAYARAADAERKGDPELGGIAIRLLREDQNAGGLMQTAYSTRGFVVYSAREVQGEAICNARMYGLPDGLPDAEIARAERFDLILNKAGDFQRYRIKDAPKPGGATREWKLICAPVDDPSPFHLQE